MKLIIRAIVTTCIAGVIFLTIMAVSGRMNRSMELKSNLPSAAEETAENLLTKKYDIADKYTILIAEKTGPHFAVGDTCYSWAEDTPVYNPDKKEIIARDNEISIRRKEDPGEAYFGHHLDITIPYDELGSIEVQCADGRRILIFADGKFVLPGTEELNRFLN